MTGSLDRRSNNQRARGRYLGGKVPFGYRVGENGALIEHEAEQEAIRAMIAMRMSVRLDLEIHPTTRPAPPCSGS